jgi:hypothetical protein
MANNDKADDEELRAELALFQNAAAASFFAFEASLDEATEKIKAMPMPQGIDMSDVLEPSAEECERGVLASETLNKLVYYRDQAARVRHPGQYTNVGLQLEHIDYLISIVRTQSHLDTAIREAVEKERKEIIAAVEQLSIEPKPNLAEQRISEWCKRGVIEFIRARSSSPPAQHDDA